MISVLPLLALAGAVLAKLPPLGGINLAGLEFGTDIYGNAQSAASATPFPTSQIQHFASAGANLIRIPFTWQYIQPTLSGELNSNYLNTLDGFVQAALATGAYVEIDLHNYGRRDNKIVGKDGPTNAQFSDVWWRLANKYKSQSRVIFGLMNEPHDLNDFPAWVTTVQAAVNAIRAAGANTQHILLPGNDWTHIASTISTWGPALLKVYDPAGGVDKLVLDVHAYLDYDNSGTHLECSTDNVALIGQLVAWLRSNGRQAILSETGANNNEGCIQKLGAQLAAVAKNSDVLGFAAWAAGSFNSEYELTLTPSSSGEDNALAKRAVFPNFPRNFKKRSSAHY